MTRRNEREAILSLQRDLRQLSFTEPEIAAPPRDGVFGTATADALRAFQRLSGLPETGRADQKTFETLHARAEHCRACRSPAAIALFPCSPSDFCLRAGDTGLLVRVVQYALGELSLLTDDANGLAETGTFDEATARAVKDFQRRHGMAETGEVERETWNAIAADYGIAFRPYLRQ